MFIEIKNKIKKPGILLLLVTLVAFAGCGEQINHLEVGEALLEQGKIATTFSAETSFS